MRKLRYIPQEGTLVEVTCRMLHSRLLMRPSPEVCEIDVGVLGRAQELYPVTVCGAVCLGNHYTSCSSCRTPTGCRSSCST